MGLREIRKIIFLGLGVALFTSFGSFSQRDMDEAPQQEKIGLTKVEVTMEERPTYLYKVLSMDDWAKSCETVHLSSMDTDFIHLSTEDQLDKITEKYWAGVPEYIVLKIETKKLRGKLVLEANSGGINKYYHLYNGSIPLNAIVESKIKNA